MARDRPPEHPVTLFHKAESLSEQADEQLPSGKLRMIITYLELTHSKQYDRQPSRSENLSVIRAHDPHAGFYRYLYNAVGEKWLWYERNLLSDEELENIIRNPKVKIYVLYINGTPAGFGELDCQVKKQVQLAYFGLMPQYFGRGLGKYFLRHLIESAWADKPDRVWVHTCNFDAPSAMATYQIFGFTPYRQEIRIIDDPRNNN